MLFKVTVFGRQIYTQNLYDLIWAILCALTIPLRSEMMLRVVFYGALLTFSAVFWYLIVGIFWR